MYYSITHLTLYQYSEAITNSVMEVRKQPRTHTFQRCLQFNLSVSPMVKIFAHEDHLGNTVHTFNISASHNRLAIRSQALVEVLPRPALPAALAAADWDVLDASTPEPELFDMLLPGHYATHTPLLEAFAAEIGWGRRADPLTLVKELNTAIYHAFDYQQHVTRFDSSIDIALEARRGVCQDFAHIMLALLRQIGIPARYVSGYLFHRRAQAGAPERYVSGFVYHRRGNADRSDADASHAWVEAWLPHLGWIGFDPTNNLIVTDRHICVSMATDYAGASPSRGVFIGSAETDLSVRVHVVPTEETSSTALRADPATAIPNYELQPLGEQQQQQ